jgi:hypothetical protein
MARCFPSPQQLEDVLCINIPDQILENLYARLQVVDKLIRSLEDYQRVGPEGGGKCLSFIAGTK